MMDPNHSYPGSGTESFPTVADQPPLPPAPPPPSPPARHRGRKTFLLGALLVLLLVGGYAYATRDASPEAAPTTPEAAAGSLTPSAADSAPSASDSPSPSTAPSSAKPSASASDAAQRNTVSGWPGPNNTGIP